MWKALVTTAVLLSTSAWADVISIETESTITLENKFTQVIFDKTIGAVTTLAANFAGDGSFANNVLVKPFGLDTIGRNLTACSHEIPTAPLKAKWLSKNGDVQSFQVIVMDCYSNPLISETWTISLRKDIRVVEFLAEGTTLRSGQTTAIVRGLYLKTLSSFGLFDRGVAQMMNKLNGCLGSDQPLSRAYFLGGGAALDVLRDDNPRSLVLMSKGENFQSGFQDIVIGSYPALSLEMVGAWGACWSNVAATSVTAGQVWTHTLNLIPNNFDFPAYLVSDVGKQPKMPFLDLQTYLMGIYASPVGCLQGYFDKHQGTIAPTVSHPDVGYSPDTNFFDPDNFIALSAVMYSGDSYLLQQVQRVLEVTGDTMCGIGTRQLQSYCGQSRQRLFHKMYRSMHRSLRWTPASSRAGQLMHHFVSLVPTYDSIAGSEQLGPNIFWTMAVLRYISITQDLAWAQKMLPYIDLSTHFLLTFFDESKGLIAAPGPLWIDVIVRENYTSDSSAAVVPLFREIANFYDMMGENPGFAKELRDLSSTITEAMNKFLWDTQSNDHYVTQLNPDGTTRDFVDFDSNLMAVAFDIAPANWSAAILKRVDSYQYAHVRATWCSEKPYTGDRCDCYIVGGTVCGDSVVTLARIGWVDTLARKKTGDLTTFNDLLLLPLQNDLVKNVWLYERYDYNGAQIRTSFYFEYPSFVAMMLREIRYGVNLDLLTVTIDPFPAAPFYYSFGDISVDYSEDKVVMTLPHVADSTPKNKVVNIQHMVPNSKYTVANTCKSGSQIFSADGVGKLSFTATFMSNCQVSASRMM